MKKTFALLAVLVLFVGFSGLALADDGSWTGYISDSSCAKNFEKSSAENHAACAKACVSKGGQWALSMKDGMVILDISKDTAEKNLGHMVTVKGTLDMASNTVKVASVDAAK